MQMLPKLLAVFHLIVEAEWMILEHLTRITKWL
jgi:hypothetical protein